MPTWLHGVNSGYTDSPTANMVEHSKGSVAGTLQRLGSVAEMYVQESLVSQARSSRLKSTLHCKSCSYVETAGDLEFI